MDQPRRIGLALGGGMVRGIAHVGVLQALAEAGIPIDCVAGTSAGSLVGAAYCAGMSLDEIEALACRMRWWNIARPAWPVRGFLSFQRLEYWLQRTAGALDFNNLRVPLTITATDLDTGSPVYLSKGPVAPAVHASCIIPGIITPVRIDGRLLGDGSLVNTIPVHPLRLMGADFIIGVDLFQHKIRRWLGPLGYGLAALEITFSRAGCGYCTADCLITPDLTGKTYLNFWKAHELLEIGRRAAQAKIPEIKAMLGMT